MKSINVLTKSLILTSLIVLSVPAALAGGRHDDRQQYRSHQGNYNAHYNRDRHGYRHNKVRRLKQQNRRLRHRLHKQRHYARDHYRAERHAYGHSGYRGRSYWRYPLSSSYYITSPRYSVSLRYNDWNW